MLILRLHLGTIPARSIPELAKSWLSCERRDVLQGIFVNG